MRHFDRVVFLAGLLLLCTVAAWGQPWVNPGTTDPSSSCQPFDVVQASPPAPPTAFYCSYVGSFPWFAAGAGWTSALRVAAPSNSAIEVKYLFRQVDANGSVLPTPLDYLPYGATSPEQLAEATVDLNPNQPSELTLLGKSGDGAPYAAPASGLVYVSVRCPNKNACASAMPQLIYSSLPSKPWYLSGTMNSDVSLPTKTDNLAWSAVGINDPQPEGSASPNQVVSFVILNTSPFDRAYTVAVYDQTGAIAGSQVVQIATGRNFAHVLDETFMPNVPKGLLKLRVEGTQTGANCIVTMLQFKGAAATALLPVAEQ